MNINHKVNIFFDSKKWLNKTIFSSKKNVKDTIYNFSYKTLEHGTLNSRFKKNKFFNTNINFILSDDKLLKKLNTKFLKKTTTTNVLSFPNDNFQKNNIDFLGEIYLAYNTCINEAKKLNVSNINRVGHLIIHGTLHLLGFDHKNEKEQKKMKVIEDEILNFFNIHY